MRLRASYGVAVSFTAGSAVAVSVGSVFGAAPAPILGEGAVPGAAGSVAAAAGGEISKPFNDPRYCDMHLLLSLRADNLPIAAGSVTRPLEDMSLLVRSRATMWPFSSRTADAGEMDLTALESRISWTPAISS